MAKETDALHFFDIPIEHFPDRSAKWLLEDSNHVRGLLEIVASDLVDRLDFRQLSHVNTTFIPDNLRQQESDIVYSVPFRGEDETGEVWIYILIEHRVPSRIAKGYDHRCDDGVSGSLLCPSLFGREPGTDLGLPTPRVGR